MEVVYPTQHNKNVLFIHPFYFQMQKKLKQENQHNDLLKEYPMIVKFNL